MQQLSDFSLVAGGPLYQFWRRTRLSGDALELPQRRVLVLVVLIWIPLLVLSMIEGRAWGNGLALPFLHDIETHLRLLIAAPLLAGLDFSSTFDQRDYALRGYSAGQAGLLEGMAALISAVIY